ncbi:MAG: hypothetical protein Q8L48_09670 [Archangium sp.]|nr:hypothetical protein [Archangium sp.]
MADRPPPRRPAPKGNAIERSTGRGRPVRTSRMSVESASPRPSRRPQLAAALVVLVVLLVSVKLFIGRRPGLDPNTRGSSEVAVMFTEAKTLIRQGRWAEAKLKLEEIREEDEDYETRQLENYLKVVASELPNEARFATAADATAKGELGRASAALAQVKTTTQDRALTDAKAALALRIESRRAEARTMLEPPAKWEGLLALSEDLLVAVPGDREAAEWKQQAEQAIARGKRGVTKVVTAETPWLEAQQLFKSGDVTGARSLAQRCAKKHAKCRDLENGLAVLEAKSRNLEALGDGDLLTLFKLDKELAGGVSSETSKPLRTLVASRYFLKASKAKTSGSWAKAVEFGRTALEADPGHAGAQAILTEAKQISSELYYRAYQQRDTDQVEALKLFKEVLAMTTPDDPNHVKAQGYIERFQAR